MIKDLGHAKEAAHPPVISVTFGTQKQDFRRPREVLEFYRELMKISGYTLETAGALDGGRVCGHLREQG